MSDGTTDAATAAALSSLRQMSLEHDPATPDIASPASEDEANAPVASTSVSPPIICSTDDATTDNDAVEQEGRRIQAFEKVDDGFIFGASTRLGGRILHEGRDPWTHNAW
jgi:hypothetical protein